MAGARGVYLRMSTYVLVPGAGGDSWYWQLVARCLEGHEVLTPDLPAGDDDAGLHEYTAIVLDTIGDRSGVVVVGQSMGAYPASMACAHADVARLVLVAPMIPAPGETPGEWWEASGQTAAQVIPFDPIDSFFHDVPEAVVAEAMSRGEPRQSGRPFRDPWPLGAWPDVPTEVIAGRHDRLFPEAFMRTLVGERLGLEPHFLDCGHLPALSRPRELASRLSHA
jgi:pimeloyl-ACP methyl ester carboxylesterase